MEKPAMNQQLAKLGELERRILDKVLRRQTVARDTVAEFERRLGFGERLADRIASFGGSWTFIAIFVAVMLAWIVLNVLRPAGFDPYPFILLNLVPPNSSSMRSRRRPCRRPCSASAST